MGIRCGEGEEGGEEGERSLLLGALGGGSVSFDLGALQREDRFFLLGGDERIGGGGGSASKTRLKLNL